jgi:hypothetical protein
LVNFYQTTRCYNPEDSNLHTHRRENLKSYYAPKLSTFKVRFIPYGRQGFATFLFVVLSLMRAREGISRVGKIGAAAICRCVAAIFSACGGDQSGSLYSSDKMGAIKMHSNFCLKSGHYKEQCCQRRVECTFVSGWRSPWMAFFPQIHCVSSQCPIPQAWNSPVR